jgi:hypothetical protein
MQTILHYFKTAEEARSFLEGIEFANDSALQAVRNPCSPKLVVTIDEDGDSEETIEVREH